MINLKQRRNETKKDNRLQKGSAALLEDTIALSE